MGRVRSTQPLAGEWRRACDVVLSPWVLGPIVLTGCFTYLAVLSETKTVTASFSLLANISAALVGAVVWDKWLKSSSSGVLVARGKDAIRGLKVLLNTLSIVDRRIRHYAAAVRGGPVNPEVHEVWLDETVEKLNIISEQAVSSIEGWTDILGDDASVHILAGRLTELQLKRQELEYDRAAAEQALKTAKTQSAEERARLSDTLEAAKVKLTESDAALRQEWLRTAAGPLSGLNVGSWLVGPPSSMSGDDDTPRIRLVDGEVVLDQKCPKCRKRFFPRGSGSAISMSRQKLCEECEEKVGV